MTRSPWPARLVCGGFMLALLLFLWLLFDLSGFVA